MKTRILTLLALAGFALLAGCQTVDSRIKEKPELFAKLDPATQDKIKQGIIDIGFTQDMVYLALGKPDQVRESKTTEGQREIWIYSTYYDVYDGTHFVGYHRSIYFDPYLHSYRLYHHPILAEEYHEDREDRIKVVFKDGKAVMIEQAKE